MATKDFVPIQLRLPEDLHAKLRAEASANGRSFNAEVVLRLGEVDKALDSLVSKAQEFQEESAAARSYAEHNARLIDEYKKLFVQASAVLSNPNRGDQDDKELLAQIVAVLVQSYK